MDTPLHGRGQGFESPLDATRTRGVVLRSHLSPSQGTGRPFSGYTRSLTIVPHLAGYRRKRRALVMGNAENGRNKDVVLALR